MRQTELFIEYIDENETKFSLTNVELIRHSNRAMLLLHSKNRYEINNTDSD
jgi:hypothetical protein